MLYPMYPAWKIVSRATTGRRAVMAYSKLLKRQFSSHIIQTFIKLFPAFSPAGPWCLRTCKIANSFHGIHAGHKHLWVQISN